MSSSRLGYGDEHFDFVTAFEVLEHVSDLQGTIKEICRVCSRTGVIVISAPQVGFPLENHGMKIGSSLRAQDPAVAVPASFAPAVVPGEDLFLQGT